MCLCDNYVKFLPVCTYVNLMMSEAYRWCFLHFSMSLCVVFMWNELTCITGEILYTGSCVIEILINTRYSVIGIGDYVCI